MAEIKNSKLNNEKILAAIEAVLFAYGEPIQIKKIFKLLNAGEEEIKEALERLNQRYSEENRGLKLIFADEKVQLTTKPEFSPLLENFAKEEFKEDLTPAALETLSIIAYFGPISKAKIDYFRGVNSAFILRNLLMRGLIDRSEKSKEEGYAYSLSFDALKHLGISKIEELPEYEKYKNNPDLIQ